MSSPMKAAEDVVEAVLASYATATMDMDDRWTAGLNVETLITVLDQLPFSIRRGSTAPKGAPPTSNSSGYTAHSSYAYRATRGHAMMGSDGGSLLLLKVG
jgi:hypothetical protein